MILEREGFFEVMEYNDDVPHLSILWRYILLPINIVNWVVQLLLFSFIGIGFGYPFAFMGAISDIFSCPEDRNFVWVCILIMPITFPFIWWYKYIRYGEYGALIEM